MYNTGIWLDGMNFGEKGKKEKGKFERCLDAL